MLGFFNSRRGYKAAVSEIAPLVQRSRSQLQGIPDAAWLEPYLVGFLGMLITIIAQRRAGTLGTNALAWIQAKAWAAITGLEEELIGEEIGLLTMTKDAAFEQGCENAARFIAALEHRPAPMTAEEWEMLLRPSPFSRALEAPLVPGAEQQAVAELWAQYFDNYITKRPPLPNKC